jgi:hypothetical protein
MSTPYAFMTTNEKIYGPLEQKTFQNALAQFFLSEVPQIGGEMIIELIVRRIQELIEAYYPKSERLSMGQLLWFAIDENEKAGYGKSMTKTKIKPVILTVVHPADIRAIKQNTPLKQIIESVIIRLYREAKEQGAVLAESDLSLILHLSIITISKKTKLYEKKHQVVLPRRGTIHDLGPSVTHKQLICKKRKLERKTISQIARETDHTPQAITRYTTDLDRVHFCLKRKLSIRDTSFVTKLSPKLTLEYVNLIDDIKQQQKHYENETDLPF